MTPTPDTDIRQITLKMVLLRDVYITDPPWPVMSRRCLQCWLLPPHSLMPANPRNLCDPYANFTLSLN